MLFGHNSDVKVGDTVFHVQTEDRGTATALIDTTVYCRGRVLHRRNNHYRDLLPWDAQHESTLRKRIDDQHRGIIEEIRSGALQLAVPAAEKPAAQKPGVAAVTTNPIAPATDAPLALELLNPKTWLSGRHANLRVTVRQKQSGAAVAGAKIVAQIEGAAHAAQFSAQSGADGHARLEFEMPELSGADPALVIEAIQGAAKGQLKFHLRARPRVPSA